MTEGVKNNSGTPRELGEELKKIILEKRILKTIKPYFEKVGNFDPASGVTLNVYKNFLHDHGYNTLRDQFILDVKAKIDKRMGE